MISVKDPGYWEEQEDPEYDCDGIIKYYKDAMFGTINQCPVCKHWNLFYHTNTLVDDLTIDNPENLTGYCGCCGWSGHKDI